MKTKVEEQDLWAQLWAHLHRCCCCFLPFFENMGSNSCLQAMTPSQKKKKEINSQNKYNPENCLLSSDQTKKKMKFLPYYFFPFLSPVLKTLQTNTLESPPLLQRMEPTKFLEPKSRFLNSNPYCLSCVIAFITGEIVRRGLVSD